MSISKSSPQQKAFAKFPFWVDWRRYEVGSKWCPTSYFESVEGTKRFMLESAISNRLKLCAVTVTGNSAFRWSVLPEVSRREVKAGERNTYVCQFGCVKKRMIEERARGREKMKGVEIKGKDETWSNAKWASWEYLHLPKLHTPNWRSPAVSPLTYWNPRFTMQFSLAFLLTSPSSSTLYVIFC